MTKALLLLALAACGDPVAPPAVDAPPARVVVGTVDASKQGFVPMAGDQTLVAGAQGGFHVWLKYRVVGLQARTVRVLRTVRRVADDRLILKTDDIVDLGAPGADGYWELPAPVPSFMCPAPLGVQVNDQPVRFEVQLVDPDSSATLADGTAGATPRCPTADATQHAFCVSICSGS